MNVVRTQSTIYPMNDLPTSSMLDKEIERLEKAIAARGYYMPDSESELYDLLRQCEASGKADQVLKVLSMLVDLHFEHNDMLEWRSRCVEGIKIAQSANNDHYLKRFKSSLEYYNQRQKEQDNALSCAGMGCLVFVVLSLIFLGYLVFSIFK